MIKVAFQKQQIITGIKSSRRNYIKAVPIDEDEDYLYVVSILDLNR